MICPRCSGAKYIPTYAGRREDRTEPCPDCRGTGNVVPLIDPSNRVPILEKQLLEKDRELQAVRQTYEENRTRLKNRIAELMGYLSTLIRKVESKQTETVGFKEFVVMAKKQMGQMKTIEKT